MTTFESRDDVLDRLISPERTTGGIGHGAWAWARFLERLDQAGYAIVKKPTLLEHGKPGSHATRV